MTNLSLTSQNATPYDKSLPESQPELPLESDSECYTEGTPEHCGSEADIDKEFDEEDVEALPDAEVEMGQDAEVEMRQDAEVEMGQDVEVQPDRDIGLEVYTKGAGKLHRSQLKYQITLAEEIP